MTRLASIIAGLVAVAMLLCAPGCMSGPAFAPGRHAAWGIPRPAEGHVVWRRRERQRRD